MNTDKKINYEDLKNIADTIINGTAAINCLSLGEEQGRRKGGRRNVEASVLVRGSKSTDNAPIRQNKKKQESILKKYAKEVGIWIEPKQISKWQHLTTRGESHVYYDDGFVFKVVYNYANFYDTPYDFLTNKISLHNYIFKEDNTQLELVGFTETCGRIPSAMYNYFAPVIKQNHIQGRELYDDEQKLLDQEMFKRGFTNRFEKVYYNTNYLIEDLHNLNVMIDEDGNFFFIDTVPKLNTPDLNFDGIREYGDNKIINL